ncbi:F-box/FBD/LRR-repeat protein [Cinnamomum micranthum f. kanehirae]|uniref:F-box/FBD/LRR-repeat protein n=1 Tax=Cinnamomum micranthum f. kanehirae TaxID=337451 RepID=A0A443NS05_9MAGN|nr:F-box/FBD/LRR-repeat protein [Cinnamomum micranthum f. kanehirae]
MKKRKRTGQFSQGSIDSISNLPEDVMNLILVRLPIRDAVRTGILSKKWRYKWVNIPDIVFNEGCLMKGKSKTKHASAVDHVLLSHVGPICKFSCMSYVPGGSHFDRWILILSKKGIKKLSLKVNLLEKRYYVPSSIFNCQELCHLELFYCILKVPPTFKGFHNLLVLDLDNSISEDDIEYLISKCPLLERLKLYAEFFKRFHIHAPNLRYLEFYGFFRDLSIGSSPLLTNMSLDFCLPPDYWDDYEKGNNFLQFIGCSHGIERLALKGTVLQFLCVGSIPEKLSATYDHLKCLEVDIKLNSKEILAILCILRSAPNLKELKIGYYLDSVEGRYDLFEEEGDFWGAETQFDCLLSHLRTVEVFGVATLLDLVFIRCILSNAPVLEIMKIYTNDYVEAEEVSRILKELLRFRRASTAEILYLGHYEVTSW